MMGVLETIIAKKRTACPARFGLIKRVVGSAVVPLASRTENPDVIFCCHHLPVFWLICIVPITFEQMSSPSHVLAKTKALCFLRCEEASLGTVGAEIGTRGTWLSPAMSRKRNPAQGFCQDLLVIIL